MGRLLVVGTPIGNLGDITLRALEALRSVHVVLAEDTRHTRRLLSHFDISVRVLSYHQHNKDSRIQEALALLAEHDLALVTDAGMPSIADPGFELIAAAATAGIEVDVLPGPSAVTTAVVGAALPAPGFLFLGFLPRRSTERRQRLAGVRPLPFSLVVYEAPHRLIAMLDDARAVLGNRPAVAARELTKLHQEYLRGSLESLAAHVREYQPRGEFTVVIGGSVEEANAPQPDAAAEAARRLRAGGTATRAAVTTLMQEYAVSRNLAYRLWVEAGADVEAGKTP